MGPLLFPTKRKISVLLEIGDFEMPRYTQNKLRSSVWSNSGQAVPLHLKIRRESALNIINMELLLLFRIFWRISVKAVSFLLKKGGENVVFQFLLI